MRSKPRTYYRAYQNGNSERVVAVLAHSPMQAAREIRRKDPSAERTWPVSAEYYKKWQDMQSQPCNASV